MPCDRANLPSLTSLRFITALHVFLFHLEASNIHWAPEPIRQIASVGYVGVNWFFILSGFILTYSYAGRQIALSHFWRARFARVYPAYFVSLCLAAPFFIYVCFYVPLSADQNWIAVMCDSIFSFALLSLVLVQAWVPAAAFSINPVGWSLSVEAFFYLIFPLLLVRTAHYSVRSLILLIVALGCSSIAIAYAYVALSPDGISHVTYDMNHLPWLNALRFNPLVRLPEFLLGACGALLFLLQPIPTRWATLLVASGLILFSLAIFFSDKIPYPIMHNGLLSLPFLAIIYGIALRPAWSAFFELRTFQMLGEISYSFFLTHGIFIAIFFRPSASLHSHSIIDVLFCLLLSITLAFCLYRWVEQPMRHRFLISKTKRKSNSSEKNENRN